MICTVVNKHSQPRMGMSTLLDNIVNQTIVYYSETSDPTENANHTMLENIEDLNFDGHYVRALINRREVFLFNPPEYTGELLRMAQDYEIPVPTTILPMQASELRKISVDHINPISKYLVVDNKQSYPALYSLDRFLRRHENVERCKLDNNQNFLSDCVLFKQFCNKVRDAHPEGANCDECHDDSFINLCIAVYEELKLDVAKGLENSRLFGIQLMDYSTNCSRGNSLMTENRILHQIIDILKSKNK